LAKSSRFFIPQHPTLGVQPAMQTFANPEEVMRRAIEIAARGAGRVEPNPLVGAIIVDEDLHLIGEGWHEQFGGPHAEVMALAIAGSRARGGTLFVTLEPCCHFGKTPPCVDAILAAGLHRVVIAMQDPFPQVAGRGIEKLRAAKLDVSVGLQEDEARRLTAPFCKLVASGLPYVHAKWAMSLDGRIATASGASKWISNAASRQVVHVLRGRMDAIAVGVGTALADDPLLTARPAGPRTATRIVFDSRARLPVESQLIRTIDQAPVLVVCSSLASRDQVARLRDAGAEVLEVGSAAPNADAGRPDPAALLAELGRRKMTNLLLEGGAELLGTFFDRRLIDEVHVFIAPKLLGGVGAKSPLGGIGRSSPSDLPDLDHAQTENLDGDLYIHGQLVRS
jgi:diaminohydroxyphosphoribosylaminopyrimidine deaminase / 5-amino-6-(5-phosphoribosylamino)uracil reductase